MTESRSALTGVGLLCLVLSLRLAHPAFAQDAPPAAVPAAPSETVVPAPTATPATATEPQKPVVAPKPVSIPYQEQVYRVSLTLGVDQNTGLSPPEVQRLIDQLRGQVESRIGIWWDCEVTRAPAGQPLSRATLARQSAESYNAKLEPTVFEKKFALTLERSGSELILSGVEWDRASQTTTPLHERRTTDRRAVATQAADLVFELFRPLVSVELVTENKVEMRIRGGEFLPPDVELTPFQVGDFTNAFTRHLGKNRELKRLKILPWTMIRIDLCDRSYVQGTIISAFGAPLAGSRRRVEMLGLRIRPDFETTRLQVIPRGKPESPMAGYRVEILDRPETKEDQVTDRLTLRTDRNGEIVIPADAEKPLRYLIVYSGIAPLAKVPMIPGLAQRLVLDAPDDAPRLNVEAETELLQSELVDLVARREVLMARARGASKKANWELVDDLMKQVKALPTLAQFQVRIEALKNPAVQAAKKSKDKSQESRIVRMCKQITETATQHLDPIKVKEFQTEIEEERKAAK